MQHEFQGLGFCFFRVRGDEVQDFAVEKFEGG